MFTRDDAAWLSEAVLSLYSASTAIDYTGKAIETVYEKFRLHSCGCEELGRGMSLHVIYGMRCAVAPPRDLLACYHDNPFNPIVMGSAPLPDCLHLTHHVSRSAWMKTDHYNGVARPMGWSDQLIVVAQKSPTFVGVEFYRDTPFTATEVELAALLQPHLLAAWARVRKPALPTSGREPFIITLTAEGRVVPLAAAERAALKSYFPGWRRSEALPMALRTWMEHSVASLRATPPSPLRAFIVEGARGRLIARCFPSQADGRVRVTVMEEPWVPNWFALGRHGLTSRECEVLHWIAQGKRDAEIAAILATSTRTVAKHVEHILAKLQAESRAGAVSVARALLDTG